MTGSPAPMSDRAKTAASLMILVITGLGIAIALISLYRNFWPGIIADIGLTAAFGWWVFKLPRS